MDFLLPLYLVFSIPPRGMNYIIVMTFLAGVPPCFSVFEKSYPLVTTRNGRVMGKNVTTRGGREVAAFLGIPFGKPPVGKLRFTSPQPVDPWPGTFIAKDHPKPCMQSVDPRGSEDCLYLNVYTPDTPEIKNQYPVYFYIYGGLFELGSIDGFTWEYLMDEDIVLVVAQYRLGMLGFLSTGDKVVPGNMGFKDQRLALRWVRDNIKQFGGDPDRVTIGGESAGAVSTHYHLLYTAKEGLFRGGITQSGCALLPWGFRPPKEMKHVVETLSNLTNCPKDDSQTFVNCLRDMSANDVVVLYSVKYKNTVYGGLEVFGSQFLPLIAGVVEPECVEDRFVTGNPWQYNVTVPWIVGVNSKEGLVSFVVHVTDLTNTAFTFTDKTFDKYFPLSLNYQSSTSSANMSQITQAVKEYYLDMQPISRATLNEVVDLTSDALFIYGTYEAAKRGLHEKTYFYWFDYLGGNTIPVLPDLYRIGAVHGDELYFFFPHPGSAMDARQSNTDADLQMSKKMIKMWYNFIDSQDPTPSGKFTWKPFYPDDSYLSFKRSGNREMKSQLLHDRMAFWDSMPYPNRNDYFDNPPCEWEVPKSRKKADN